MSKRVIRLTESELKQLIKESVEETINTLEEGAAWDVLKRNASQMDGTEDMSLRKNWDEIKDVWNGSPNQREYELARMLRNSARFDRDRATTQKERDFYDTKATDYAEDELYAQPGLRGKMRRAGYIAGAYGAGLAKKLGRKLSGK